MLGPYEYEQLELRFGIDCRGLWNCNGVMKTIFPKNIPSVAALIMVLESAVHHAMLKSPISDQWSHAEGDRLHQR